MDAGSGKRNSLLIVAAIISIAIGAMFFGTGKAQAAWQQVSHFWRVQGRPVKASANVLSEHETGVLDQMSPQSQAELLLERTTNHYHGASEALAARVDGWRGKITLEGRLNTLFTTALNSDDLRVRAAAIEVDLAARNLEKSTATVDLLEQAAHAEDPNARANALWYLGLLGNRGVEPGRASETLLGSLHDPNETVRYWAVEGTAYLGTDETIAPLLDVFHDDPSPNIRERAACGLSQSGMLSEKQRRTAVPKLLDFAEDSSLDPKTHEWVFEALRDITGQTLPHDAAAWRNWYRNGDVEWHPVTRDSQ